MFIEIDNHTIKKTTKWGFLPTPPKRYIPGIIIQVLTVPRLLISPKSLSAYFCVNLHDTLIEVLTKIVYYNITQQISFIFDFLHNSVNLRLNLRVEIYGF